MLVPDIGGSAGLTGRARAVLVGVAATVLVGGGLAAAPAEASAAAAPHYSNYVALGDSYTSSDGFALNGLPTTQYVPLGCVQSSSDYPHQVASLLHVAHFADASCAGATTQDFTAAQATVLGTNAPQFDRLSAQTDLVTIGIGGNDTGLVPLAESCIVDSLVGASCEQANTVQGVDQVAAKITATRQVIITAIDGVRARAPHARIAIVNYLDAVPDNGRACFPYFPMTQENVTWFTQKFKDMNAMLADAAQAAGATLVDTYTPTIGRDVCQLPTVRYVESLGGPSLNPVGSIAAPLHPNQAGANAQAAIVYAALQNG
jgi:lysophospholipase L1-like esterase